MRSFYIFLIFIILAGCSRDNAVSSTRSLNRQIVGTWVIPNQDFTTEEFEDWVSIIFKSDGTFTAPWGLAGPLIREYRGSYWQKGDFIGTRGIGGVGEGGVMAKFARLETTHWTEEPAEGMGLVITEVKDDYVATPLSFGTLENMAAGKVQEVLDKLNNTSLPPEALGESRIYIKIELPPLVPQN